MKNKNKRKREWVKEGKTSPHHLTPKSRGGSSTTSNLLNMDNRRHQAWHLIFGNKTLPEIINLLERVLEIKEEERFKKLLQ